MNAPREIRLLLVDDSSLVRQGIKSVLERQAADPRITVVGEASTIAEAVAATVKLRPDVVLLDLRLPDGFGFTACRAILEKTPDTRILVLTSFAEDNYIYESITAGAHGYLLKEVDPSALVDSVIRVASGQSIISPDLTARVLSIVRSSAKQESSKLFTSLSPQEKRVLELVVLGKTNKEIAERLELSDNTVKNYLGSVFEKLNVSRRSQAAALYMQAQKTTNRPK
jgi:two-component system, NarL family, response regulator DevR